MEHLAVIFVGVFIIGITVGIIQLIDKWRTK